MDFTYISSFFPGLVAPHIFNTTTITTTNAAKIISGCSSCFLSMENLKNLRFSIGIIGNVVSLLLYAAPILTFRWVIKNKSVDKYSCIPYIMALLNCLIYTWYGSPVISHKWDNLPLVTINGVGVLLELSFILIYYWFASDRGKRMVLLIMAPVVMFCITILALTFALDDRHLRKTMVGSIGLVASIAMYGSPLVVMKQVIQTKSVEFMPFYLSFFSFLTSSLWMAYGLLSNDLLLASPNLMGCPLGILQIVLYCMYRKKKEIIEEPFCKVVSLENEERNDNTTSLIIVSTITTEELRERERELFSIVHIL